MLFSQQYPQFSNYTFNSFHYNPAVAGVESYGVASLVYRNQWVGIENAPVTGMLSVRTPIGKEKKFGIGGAFMNDAFGLVKRVGGQVSVAYHKKTTSDGKFSIGLSGGAYSIRLDDKATVEDQTDDTYFMAQDGKVVPDVSLGIHYTKNKFYAGLSAPQLLNNKVDFEAGGSESSRLNNHFFLFFGNKFKLNQDFQFEPSAQIKYQPAAPIQFDLTARFNIYKYFWLAGSYRSTDAISMMIGIIPSRAFEVYYAYDLTTSPLRQFNSGSHEIGINLKFGLPKDTDKDGIPDMDDKCPNEPGEEENEGCPFNKDRDGDGIIDKDDKCPEEAGVIENNGCPFSDRDKDGIEDELDKCPDTPGVLENEGCPRVDRDGDGVSDNLDDCPDQPGPIDNKGCPLGIQDTDGDGISDREDRCPRTYGPSSNAGCPVISDQQKEIVRLALVNLEFEFDKYKIKSASLPYLDKLADVLLENRDWNLRIAGHTDNKGTFEYNLELSKNRSEAVMSYMIERGVRRDQLVVEYYGETRPRATNDTDAGRKQNRRVELEYIFD